MKLVEILARELEVWPDAVEYMWQDYDGSWWGRGSDDELLSTHEVGAGHRMFAEKNPEDGNMSVLTITRPQWQAERDRMKAMGTQQATASTEPTYEQQLWDRVAQSTLASMLGAIGGADFFVDDACTQKAVSSADFASCAADYADAFMAERAKRVGK